jgi:DNA-binding CsgD family transcriptional regulator
MEYNRPLCQVRAETSVAIIRLLDHSFHRQATRMHTARPAPSALVGREREFALLRAHFDAAMGGQGSLVLIGGEAGIGKTTLAEAICREATEHGALVLVGRCYDLAETPPYGPWVELFARCPRSDAAPPLPDVFAMRGTLGTATSQAAILQQALDYFTTLSAARPLLLLLDDLHWADPASLDLLRLLARSLADLPLAILATYRSDELTRRHPLYQLLPTLVRESGAGRLDLRALDRAAIRTLVTDRYPLPDAEAERLTTYVHTRTEGNALFVGELMRTLEEEGVLRQADEGWKIGDLGGIAVPPLLRQVIDGRVGRLDEEAQHLLTVAAVIGQVVSLALWTAVAEAEDTVLAAAEQASEARLLVESATGEGVRFAHALIREAVYAGIAPVRRRLLHRRVGEVLAATRAPDPDAVAYHLQHAGDARAAVWLIAAGDRAQQAYAWLTAAERFEAALVLLEAHPPGESTAGWLHYRLARMHRLSDPARGIAHLDTAERTAGETGDRALAAGVRYTRGQLRILMGEVAGGLTELRAGVEGLATLTEAEQERLNAHDDTSRGTMESRRGLLVLHLATAGHLTEAVAMGEAVVRGLPTDPREIAGAGGLHSLALLGLGVAYALLGRVAAARTAFARGRSVARAMGHQANVYLGIVQELWLVSVPYLSDDVAERERLFAEAEVVWEQSREMGLWRIIKGMLDQILVVVTGAWDVAREVAEAEYASRESLFRPLTLGTLAQLARTQGRVVAAAAYLREQFPAGPETEPGDVSLDFGPRIQSEGAALALDAGDLPGARAWLEAHDRWLAWSEAVLRHSEGEALWARYHRQAGDLDQARIHAEQALAHATEPRQPLALLAAHRLLGELDTDAGRHDEAARHLDASLRLADACQAPYEQALTLLALAELRAATAEPDDARALLDEAQAICLPLDAKPALARIAAIQTRLAATSAAPAYPAGLSPREVEVLRLVARGFTNPQVAEQLCLSPRTVATHLQSIYNKLDVPSRTAAAAVAIQHGLV